MRIAHPGSAGILTDGELKQIASGMAWLEWVLGRKKERALYLRERLDLERILIGYIDDEPASILTYRMDGRGPVRFDRAGLVALNGWFAGSLRYGAVMAIASLRRSDELYVESFRTRPSHRGAGLGSALIAMAETEARAAGKRIIRLHVDHENEVGLHFYHQRGYRITRTFSLPLVGRYFNHGKVHTMVKTLD